MPDTVFSYPQDVFIGEKCAKFSHSSCKKRTFLLYFIQHKKIYEMRITNMKKSFIRCASLMLAALMAVPTLASCGGDAGKTEAPATTDAQTTVETIDPNDRSQTKDTLPDNLDFNGRTFGVYCSSTKRNEEFFAGLGEETGEVVEDAVYRRNLSVQERLNIVFQSDSYDFGWKDIGGEIQKLVMAGDTTYDLFMGAQAGVTQLVTENVFVNAYDLEYIDFSQPWWNNNFMNELSVGSDYRFYLSGDFFMDALFWTRAIFFNKRMYADYYDNADELYAEVLAGKWTMDRMAEISKAVYVDLNNNGVSDADDQLGFGTYLTMSSSDPFVYGSDIVFTQRDADGFIELQMMSDDAVKLAEKLVNFFYQEGSYFNFDGDAPKETVFIEGRMIEEVDQLFCKLDCIVAHHLQLDKAFCVTGGEFDVGAVNERVGGGHGQIGTEAELVVCIGNTVVVEVDVNCLGDFSHAVHRPLAVENFSVRRLLRQCG